MFRRRQSLVFCCPQSLPSPGVAAQLLRSFPRLSPTTRCCVICLRLPISPHRFSPHRFSSTTPLAALTARPRCLPPSLGSLRLHSMCCSHWRWCLPCTSVRTCRLARYAHRRWRLGEREAECGWRDTCLTCSSSLVVRVSSDACAQSFIWCTAG